MHMILQGSRITYEREMMNENILNEEKPSYVWNVYICGKTTLLTGILH